MTKQDWVAWHDKYDNPDHPMHQRLALVQRRIREAMDDQPPGPIRVLSMCAGQGRDLLGVLADHPRRADVTARLVELDPGNAARAGGFPGVEVVVGDASLSGVYAGIVPVGIALVCGVFGNVSDEDIEHTIGWLPMFVRRGATVIWTRHREYPETIAAIKGWFARAGFAEVAFDSVEHPSVGVGTHRFTGEPVPYRDDVRLFTFR
ncbi:hypothetical protein [Actinocrispum sp. NPDC049592]|uniref:hypothetical protein n=1 Tax=Actinocrispum sp. NPDC049592 TaxID=3154835 RepID=UPI0034371D53